MTVSATDAGPRRRPAARGARRLGARGRGVALRPRDRLRRSGSTARRSAGCDPRREVQGYADLRRFGFFEDEWLRGGPVRRWVPQGLRRPPGLRLRDRRHHRRAQVAHQRRRLPHRLRGVQRDAARTSSSRRAPTGCTVGPSRPAPAAPGRRAPRPAPRRHLLHGGPRPALGHQADQDAARSRRRRRYKQHVIDQALTLLKAHDSIRCLFTTPKLLEALCEKVSLKKAGITGVFCGGTEMTPQFHRFAVEELLEGALLRAHLRQHAHGPGRAQAAASRRHLRHHLLPARRRAR